MLVIRLTRVGKKNSPAYRVVVADKKKAVKRKFIEIVGHYNPTTNPKTLVIDKERALHWISLGAQPSDTVNNLMVRLDILPKKKLVNVVYGKKTKKKDAGKEPEKSTEPKSEEAVVETAANKEEPADTSEETSEIAPAEENTETETEEAAPDSEEAKTE